MNEEIKRLLRQEFIKTIIEDEDSFEDTNAGFRKFLKRKGAPVFNYKEGGEVKEPKKTDAEIEEEIRENKKELLSKKSLLDFYKGNTLFGLDLDFANKDKTEDFGKFTSRDIKDPRIGLTIVPDVQDDTSSRWGISIGPKGGGLTFFKPFSQMGLPGDWEEIPESWYEDNIPDVNVLIPELPEMKKGGKAEKEDDEALDPLSKYKSYSELDILKNLSAKHPTGTILEENILETMPMIEPMDILPPSARPVMPSLEQLMNALYREPIGIKNGGHISKGEKVNTDLTTTVAPMSGPNPQGIRSLFKQRKRYADGGEIRQYEDLEYNPTTGNFERVIREGPYWATKEYSDPIIKIFNKEKGFIDIDKGVKGADHLLTQRTINGIPINEYLNNIPTIDPFSGQSVSAQDQLAFTQPQQNIFPQGTAAFLYPVGDPRAITYDPNNFESYVEAFKAAYGIDPTQAPPTVTTQSTTSTTPSTQKILQDYLGSLYSGPEIADMQEQTFGTSNLPGATGVVSDLRHATAASQIRDKIANAVSMGYFNPAGILPQSLGLFGSQVLGAANEIQSIRPNMQSLRDITEDLRANFYGATQVPYGQSATATYNQLLNNPGLPSAAAYQRTVNVGSSDPGLQTLGRAVGGLDLATMNTLRNNADLLNFVSQPTANMANGGLTKTIPPVRGPNPQGVESLFKKDIINHG